MLPPKQPYAYPVKHGNIFRPYRRPTGDSVTVCIAARTNEGMLILAADRMVTAGDVQFEPQNEKITFLTTAIATMFSGDAALHAEVMADLTAAVQKHVAATPTVWLRVRDVADLYIKFLNDVKARRSEAAILAPLKLTHESWLEKQRVMDSELVSKIATDLINFEIPRISVIFAGVELDDSNLAHPRIFTYHHHPDWSSLDCQDAVAFASIGSGSRHAESQFMLARHSWKNKLPETLFLTYSAKKDAEVAPGVGIDTDLFAIGPFVGQQINFSDEVRNKLDAEYKRMKKQQKKSREKGYAEITRFVEEITNRPPEGQPQQKAPDPEADNAPKPADE